MEKERPFGIMILSLIFLLLGIYNTAINVPAFPYMVKYMDIPFVALIIVTDLSLIIASIFLFLMKEWARTLAIALSVFFISFLIASFIQFHLFLRQYIVAYCASLVFFLIVLIYLSRPNIKSYFSSR